MKARELREYFQSLDSGWVNWNDTVDTFSEIPGIKRLAEHLAKRFPHIPVHLIPQSCMFQLVGGN